MSNKKTITNQLKELSSLFDSKYELDNYWFFPNSIDNDIYATRKEAMEDEDGKPLIHIYVNRVIDEECSMPILAVDNECKSDAYNELADIIEDLIKKERTDIKERTDEKHILCKKFNRFHNGSIGDLKNPFIIDGIYEFDDLNSFIFQLIEWENDGYINVADTLDLLTDSYDLSKFNPKEHYYTFNYDSNYLQVVDNFLDWSSDISDDMDEIKAIKL